MFGPKQQATREVVPGIVRSGLTLLSAKPFAGKSWLALQMAVAVASGSGMRDLRGKALYLAYDDPPWRLHQRLALLRPASNLPLVICDGWPLLAAGGLQELSDELSGKLSGRWSLVVIDSLTSALGPDLSTDCQGICRILRRLHTLAARHDAALLLVDRHRFPATVGEPDAVDAALALASAWGLFDRTLTLSRSFGQERPHLYLQGSPRPIILEQHPGLKHGAGAVQR